MIGQDWSAMQRELLIDQLAEDALAAKRESFRRTS
jgi:hypothetical protein